mmetsp:Transcript_27891/g.67796  ORF Transcript_27891/g.67796 Transcript_27891/m.67796 type:complete len:119 (-) Transcript_27891:570-926(-)|eukprot:CAMPEP_0114499674 /NCGR_PEP_ID=MMETSP0109-20121206/7549_1 /TAXON_ID=29199 /ORGANISM="Chlorarachnion reptans, Strain CCCM449" /LENGTH=118 /DNA_ID=CAMNT_0001677269 /DNA_START=240 /DNA_END=596 /DNA_ORIENTATION=+
MKSAIGSSLMEKVGTSILKALLCPVLLIMSLVVCVFRMLLCPFKAVAGLIFGDSGERCGNVVDTTLDCPLNYLRGVYNRWYVYDPYFSAEKGEARPLKETMKMEDDENDVALFDDDDV